MKPVKYLLVDDAGYRIYQSSLVVRPDTVVRYHACLQKLVPLFQAAMVKCLENPHVVNDKIIDVVKALATFWTVSSGGNQFTVDQMKSLNIVATSPDGTYGSFDNARVQTVIDDVPPIFRNQNLDSYRSRVRLNHSHDTEGPIDAFQWRRSGSPIAGAVSCLRAGGSR